jgi:protein-L-isoaspartate(D-aspartate) O-methyltransferase
LILLKRIDVAKPIFLRCEGRLAMPDPDNFTAQREEMVERAIRARGVRSKIVLDAMRSVPREDFLPAGMREFAYDDTPLPIEAEQTISQPYIVAFMVEALGLEGGERVLEIGAGSGYAAAVLSRIAGEVYTVERIGQLAEKAAARLADLGYGNVRLLHGDGTKGWPEHMPYDAIVVAAGGPKVPDALKLQLKIGGRLVIPVGEDRNVQELVRITRVSEQDFKREDLADVRFVPLVGEEGWQLAQPVKSQPVAAKPVAARERTLPQLIADSCEPFDDLETASLDALMKRIGNSRIVLLGEATHGTSEFYRMRERITRELIEKKGFRFVAIEGDWPDAARVDHYVRHMEYPPSEWTAFARFPVWMWRNVEVRGFVDWLRGFNAGKPMAQRAAFHGLDLYSLYDSIRVVLKYLDERDPQTAAVARQRYGCLTPWQSDPATYGHAALTGTYGNCEPAVTAVLTDLMKRRNAYAERDGERFLDAMQNATLVANAERYYRIMYYGSRASWNLRDTHMFYTLKTLLDFYGAGSKAVVWAHNSHIGDAAATEMSSRGEHNLGQLCRKAFGQEAYLIGFGTHEGEVAAASDWDGPMEIKEVQPSLPESYEHACHEAGIKSFLLDLRGAAPDLQERLRKPRLERAIGVIYRPQSERASHYFQAVLPEQFDEYVWFDSTRAVKPFETHEIEDMPDTYPFGL